MNRIVRTNYPAAKLPGDLREGIDPAKEVTVTVVEEDQPKNVMTLEELFALRTPPFLTKEEIDKSIERMRNEWD